MTTTDRSGRDAPCLAQLEAVAPEGSWLATASPDRSLRIWYVVTGQARALMRVDNSVHACTWLGTSALAVGGSAGMYLFDFVTDAKPATDQH